MKTSKAKINRVIDGDTVDVTINRGLLRQPQKTRIRLWGIDAPESNQKGGAAATKHLTRMIGSKTSITLEEMDVDQYDRIVGILHPGRPRPEKSYNYRMVKDGHAECYLLSGEHSGLYQDAERHAQERNYGIWKDKKRQRPGDFRKQEQATQLRWKRFWFRIKLYTLGAAAIAAALYMAGCYLNLW